jgi:uncharacterized Zn finger protein
MNSKEHNTGERQGFKVVCESCGSLSIRAGGHVTDAPDTALVECGRCGAVRGTLADLHVLARSGHDLFEF